MIPLNTTIGDIVGLQLAEEVGRGAHGIVYRGTFEGRQYAVKLTDARRGSADLRRVRREAAVLAHLSDPHLPRVMGFGEIEDTHYLVMDYISGETLDARLRSGPLPVIEAVTIAVGVAQALAHIHSRGIVHRDLKPSNILVTDSQVKLIDFGLLGWIASDGDSAVGTPRYASPEQLGALRRPIDARSDLYSLGVVLFEMLAGSPPFDSSDPSELLHMHAATPAPDLCSIRPDLSSDLAGIVAKLLRKDPDERHRSAGGLLADLLAADAPSSVEAMRYSLSPPPPTARLDSSELAGREEELAALRAAWQQAVQGRGAVAIVTAPSGMGKTRLVQHVVRNVGYDGSHILQAKCNRNDPNPFASLRDAIEGWLGPSATLPAHVHARRLQCLQKAATGFEPLLGLLSPRVAKLLGTDSVPVAGVHQEQFYAAIESFLLALASEAGALMLFLDDVQWIDSSTQRIVRRLAERVDAAPLLVVITCRSNEISTPSCGTFLEDLRAQSSFVVDLAPLGRSEVRQLVASILGSVVPDDLVDELLVRSGGNPFAVEEILWAMVESGRLWLRWGRWCWDREGLENLELSANVLQLIVQRLDRLVPAARCALEVASVVGSVFDRTVVAKASDDSEGRIDQVLTDAIEARLVVPDGATHYRFVHDQVRDALLASLDEDRVQNLHRRIAEALRGLQDGSSTRLYALAYHLSHGRTPGLELVAARTCWRAGERAIADCANEEAFGLLSRALEYFRNAGQAPEAFMLTQLGGLCAVTGRVEQAVAYYRAAIERCPPGTQRAQVRARLAWVYTWNRNVEAAWESLHPAFDDLGVKRPKAGPIRLLSALLGAIGWSMLSALGWQRRFGSTSNRQEVLAELYELAGFSCYFGNRSDLLFPQLVLREFCAALRVGPCRAQVHARCSLAALLALIGMPRVALRHVRKAKSLSEVIMDRPALAHALLFHGYVLHFQGNLRGSEAAHLDTLAQHQQWLDSTDWLIGNGDLMYNLLMRGYWDRALELYEAGLARLLEQQRTTSAQVAHPDLGVAAWVKAEHGAHLEARSLLKRLREATEQMPGARFVECDYWGYRIMVHITQNEPADGLDPLIESVGRYMTRPRLLPFHAHKNLLFVAYARLYQCRSASPEHLPARLRQLRRALADLHKVAARSVLRCHGMFMRAVAYRLEHRMKKARAQLRAAEESARTVDCPWVLFECARERAHHLKSRGDPRAAQREAEIGATLARRLGAAQTARSTAREHGLQVFDGGVAPAYGTLAPGAQSSRAHRGVDALMRVSLAAASTANPRAQARAVLSELIRLLGAERAHLFLADDASGRLRHLEGCRSDEGLADPAQCSRTVLDRVLLSRESLVVTCTQDGAEIGSESIVAQDLRSILCSPLVLQDRLIGVVYLENRLVSGVFTKEDVGVLLAIANHIAFAFELTRVSQLEIQRLQQQQLLSAERDRRILAEALVDLGRVVNASLGVDDVGDTLLKGLQKAVGFDRGAVFVGQGEDLRLAARHHFTRDELELLVKTCQSPPTEGEAQRLILPVLPPSDLTSQVGAVILERTTGSFEQGERQIASAFISQAAAALDNARLFEEVSELAVHDELTSLINRRTLLARAKLEFQRAQQQGTPMAVVVFDVDYFKRINDAHGHLVGDQVLREIAQRSRACIRQADVIGRYGGEEFVAVLSDTRATEAATHFAERLRRAIGATPIPTDAGSLRATVSVGVAERTADDCSEVDLLRRADQALYRAKQAGRDCVIAS